MIVVFEAQPPKNSERFGVLLGWQDQLKEEARNAKRKAARE
jgi:hypothetical protein